MRVRVPFNLLPALLLTGLLVTACGGKDCTPEDHTTCRDGDLMWVDSCGELGYRVKVCECGCNDASTGCEFPCGECQRTADCSATYGPNYTCDLVSLTCVCAPSCTGLCCGDDGCGSACPDDCGLDMTCDPDACQCVPAGLCVDGQTRCDGDRVQVCADDAWVDGQDCAASGQACQAGACVCVPAGDEVCNGRDDDCDGQTDEDVQVFAPEAGAEASDGLDNNCNGIADEPGGVMVEVLDLAGGRVWIDVYEATVFDNPDCTGARYGAASDDYPAGWPVSGPKQIDLYACSLPGLVPSGAMSRVRAARACLAQGKRLCSKVEWTAACASESSTLPWGVASLPPNVCNDPLSGPKVPVETGSFAGCVGEDHTHDMVGNLSEWVSNDFPDHPGMGQLAGGSYSLTICFLDACQPGDPGLQNDVNIFDSLNDCIPGTSEFNGFPADQARQEFGLRCCLDGP